MQQLLASPVPMQRVLVHHAGGTLKLPALPDDSIKSLHQQLRWLKLKPAKLPDYGNYEQLRDEQTVKQAGIEYGSRPVWMARSRSIAAEADWCLWTRPASYAIFVRRIHMIHHRLGALWPDTSPSLPAATARLCLSTAVAFFVSPSTFAICTTGQDADGQDSHLGGRGVGLDRGVQAAD